MKEHTKKVTWIKLDNNKQIFQVLLTYMIDAELYFFLVFYLICFCILS